MAPKTSLFPPNRQKIKRAEEARKNQIKTMGDLEFTADMQPQFVGQMTQEQKDFIGGENPEKSKFREIFTYLDDPIAQYGFDPDRIRFQEPDKYQIQNAWSSKQRTTTDANAEYNPGYTKTGPNKIEKDIIKYGVKLGNSKEVIAHEARHRGFQLLREMQLEGSEEDQKAWIEKYGREAAKLLDIYFSRDLKHKFSAETINEIRDRPDVKFNPPKFDAEGNPPNMGLFSGGDRNAAIQFVPTEDLRESKKSGRIQFSGLFTDLGGNLRVSLSNEFINKAFQGLDKAAKDAMKKQKDDYRNKMTVRSQEGKRKFASGGLTSHPSAMTADQYYDSESDATKQTKDILGLESVPFFKRPLDADDSDRIVGQDDAGNFVRQTVLGNKYTVARDPDQRTTRTKIEEDVIPAVKAYAKNPRLPTGEEVVGAGKAIVEGAVETASIPGDLLTGKRSPTSVQMGDAFDIAGGAAVGAGLQTLPDNAVGSMVGAFRRKEKPYVKKSIGINPDLDKTLSLKDAFGKEGIKKLYQIKMPVLSGRFDIANQIFDGVNIEDFLENVYSKLDTKKLSEPRVQGKFLSSSGEDIIKKYSDRLVLNASEDIEAKGVSVPDRVSEALSDNFTTLVDNLRHQQFSLDKKARFNVGTYDVYPVKDNIFVPTETELAFPSPRLEQKTDTSFSYPTQTINFSGPISSYVETMNIPKKGITANNFLKEIRNNLNVPVRVFPDSFVDSSKRYTREELLDLVEQKEFKVKAQEQSRNELDQRQNQAGFTYGDEQEYFFMNIAATTGAGKITPRRHHSSRDDIGHVRGSIITPSISSNFDANTETIFDVVTENKPFLLAEEFQSDLYQKGYKTTNPKFMQKAVERYYSGRSPELQKVIADSSLAANKINLPAVNDYGYIKNNTMIITDEAIERTMKDATERGYIGGDTFDSISFSVDRLKGVEIDEVFKPAYLDAKRIENTVRMLAEKGVSINLPETEVFKGEMFVPPSVDVETIFKVDPLSLSDSSFIADQSTFLDSNPQVLSRVQSMDPDTAEIFNTTTVGELNAATKEWLESLSMSAQSQGFVPSLIEDAVRNETNAERMGRGDFISADDIGGRTSGDIGDPGTISEVAENLVRKKLGLSLNDESGYPDDINSYFKLVNAYSDLIYQQISFPNDTVNVLGKLSATKKTDDKQIKKLEDYITKTTQGILDYRTKIVDQENEIDKHFEKFVGKLDGTEVTPEQAKGLLRGAYKGLKRNTNDFQGLDAVTPPIKQVKSVTDEMLKILIVKAATSGVDKIVIPPTDRIAMLRFNDHRASPEKFTQIYDEGIPTSIQELKQNYPEVIVTRDVEMPYDNSMYPPGYTDIPSNQGTVIDLEAFFKKYDVSPDGSVRQFAQGGVAMKDQMEMNFAMGGVAETVDPVSGNDVPPGSLPEEVRDDIPARLSEGEYVVPADVVRYYGVKFFEDLRTQAKMGLQQMDADGRIGGEPMEPQQAELSDDDLNSIIEQAMQQEQPMMANEGGLAGYYNGSFVGGSLFGPQPSTKDGGDVFTAKDYKLELPKVAPITTAIAGPAYETKTFYKPDGTQVSVNFINGVPQQSIQGLSAKSPNEMDKVETYNPLKGAKLNALGQPVDINNEAIDFSKAGKFPFGTIDGLFGKNAQYERSLKEKMQDPDKIKEQATQELEKSSNFLNGLGKIVLGIGGTILAGPAAGIIAAEGYDKYVTGQNIADAKVSQMVLEKQFNVNPAEVSRKVEAYTELTAAESAWNTINKKVISQTGTTNLDKILNKIGFGPQLADIEARYAALSPAEQQDKAANIIAATDTSQSAARSAQEKRLNTARTKWAGQPKGNPSWNQTGPTEETYKKYENVGRQSERITANGQVMRTQADAFNQNRADDQSAASKRAGDRAAAINNRDKSKQTAQEARDQFNADHADEIRTKYGGNKQTDSNGQDSGGTHCCTAAQARGDMTITEVKKLRAWHRQQDMFWQEGYDVWGKVIADNLVAKSKWQSDRVRDFYDHKIYGKRTIGSMYADVVIYPMSYIIGGYKVLKNTLKIKGTNYGN